MLRTGFSLDGTIASARAYVTSLGVYEMQINGRRVGDEVLAPGDLVIPSQRRYLGYVVALLEQQRPSRAPLRLERVIMNGIPRFEGGATCRPYLQIFKDARLLFTAITSSNSTKRVLGAGGPNPTQT